MERMSWKDGWHTDGRISYYIENGVLIRGKIDERPANPYVKAKGCGYDRVYNMKANKRNYFKIYWF